MSVLTEIDIQMDNILSLIQKISKLSNKSCSSNLNLPEYSLLIKSKNNNQKKTLSNNSLSVLEDNQNDLITSENFHLSHLCNRDIRALPLPKEYLNDIDRLRSYSILTMTDLIGRYLIHKTPEEFRKFLFEKVQCSQSFTDKIIQLIDTWTLYNLQVGRGTRTTTFKQYL